MLAVVLALLLAFFASVVLTGLVYRYAPSLKLMDMPTDRSAHDVPTPRGGGLGLVVVMLGGILVLWRAQALGTATALALLVGGLAVAAIGLLDDRRHASIGARLSIHFLAAGWVVYWLGPLPPLTLLPGLAIPAGWAVTIVLILTLVWLINLYNFMDGIDGIAGGEALTTAASAGALFWWTGSIGPALLALLLMAAAGGFLIWNRPPARIFLGDVGSGFLGYVFGALMLLSFAEQTLTPWVWLILLGTFIIDATWTLLRRLVRGERAYKAHASHAYQNAARRLSSHGKVTAAVMLINVLWLAPLAACAVHWPDCGLMLTAVAWLPLIGLAVYFGAGARGSSPQ